MWHCDAFLESEFDLLDIILMNSQIKLLCFYTVGVLLLIIIKNKETQRYDKFICFIVKKKYFDERVSHYKSKWYSLLYKYKYVQSTWKVCNYHKDLVGVEWMQVC